MSHINKPTDYYTRGRPRVMTMVNYLFVATCRLLGDYSVNLCNLFLFFALNSIRPYRVNNRLSNTCYFQTLVFEDSGSKH